MEALAIFNVKYLAQYPTHNHFFINNNKNNNTVLLLFSVLSIFSLHQENYEQVRATMNLTTSKTLI